MKHIKREVKLAITAIAAVIILIWGINFLKARALFEKNYVFYGVPAESVPPAQKIPSGKKLWIWWINPCIKPFYAEIPLFLCG